MVELAARGSDPFQVAARIERLPQTRWHLWMRGVIGAAWFFDGFDALAISYTLPILIGLWKLGPAEIGAMIAIGYLGQTLGSFAAGWFAERFGRVPVMAATLLIFTLGSLACIFAWDFNSLVAMRFVQGIGLGGDIPIMHAYMSEFAKAKSRARFALTVQFMFSVGLAVVAVVSNWVLPFGWQWMFVIGAVPAVLVFPMRFWLYESPRWLVTRGRDTEADAILRKLEDIAVAEGKALGDTPTDAPGIVERKPRLIELFEGIYLKRTLTLWTMWICTYFITYGLTTWLPSLYRTVFHLTNEEAVRYSSITQVVQLTGGFISIFALDLAGRKVLIGGGLVVVAASLFGLGFGVGPAAGTLTAGVVFWFITVGLPFLSFGSIGLGVWTAENYPTHLRALGGGVAGAWLRFASFVGPYVVGYVLPNYGLNAVFAMFGCSALLGALTCWLFAIETKGRALETLSPPTEARA